MFSSIGMSFNKSKMLKNNKPEQWAVMYLCAMGIDFVSSYDFSIGFWNCSDSVAFFIFHIL
jgi:hypothetical protein